MRVFGAGTQGRIFPARDRRVIDVAYRGGMFLGPILKLDQCTEDAWRIRIDAWTDPAAAPPDCDATPLPDSPVLGPWRRHSWTRSFPRETVATSGSYNLAGHTYTISVPAHGHAPHVAFFSCNGFGDIRSVRRTPDKEALWRDLIARSPQLLIGGGDQLYSDELFSHPPLERVQAPLDLVHWTPQPAALISAFLELYRRRWHGTACAQAMAQIPGIYTWDDHDIFDGWGSYPDAAQRSAGFQCMFKVAAAAFDLIQSGPGQVSQAHRLQWHVIPGNPELVIVALDVRGDRSQTQVMGETQWNDFKALLRDLPPVPHGLTRQILVVSSIPVVHMRFPRLLEHLTRELRDDIIDHWENHRHLGERLRLVANLLDHANPGQTRITILSGDVHLGCRGHFVDTRGPLRKVIHQLTSSGIVHPPPTPLELLGILNVTDASPQELEPGLVSSVADIGNRAVLAARNYLDLNFDPPGRGSRMWAQWIAEDGPVEPMLVLST